MVFPSADAIGSAAAAQASAENFPVALRMLPGRYRRRLEAVYGFARAVDDMGDEAPPGERGRLLDALEADLGRLYQFQDPALRENAGAAGPATGAAAGEAPQIGVVRALATVAGECAIPRKRSRT